MRKYVCAASAAALVAAMAVPCAALADDATSDVGELAGDTNTEADTNTDVDPAPVLDGLVEQDGASYIYRNGTLVAGKWVKLDGAKYYASTSGKLVCGTSKKINGRYWVFANNGKLLTPAKKKIYHLKSGYFYVNAKGHPAKTGYWYHGKNNRQLSYVKASGKLLANGKYQGIPFNNKGIAKKSQALTYKNFIHRLVKRLTTNKMSGTAKLKACFRYCLVKRYIIASPKIGGKAWIQKVAYSFYQRGGIECQSHAATFALMAYELGYDPIVRSQQGVHGFVMINGRAWDNYHNIQNGAMNQSFKYFRAWKISGWNSCVEVNKDGTLLKGRGWTADKQKYYIGGKAVTGVRCINKKLYAFKENGKLDAQKTQKLQKYGKNGGSMNKLMTVMGKPNKKKYGGESCVYINGVSGKDYAYVYKYVTVYVLHADNGKRYVESVAEK